MAKLYRLTFNVSGSGYFPFDMLRYDACFPCTSEDCVELTRKGERRIGLVRVFHGNKANASYQVTPGRWRSFGWRLSDLSNPQEIS